LTAIVILLFILLLLVTTPTGVDQTKNINIFEIILKFVRLTRHILLNLSGLSDKFVYYGQGFL